MTPLDSGCRDCKHSPAYQTRQRQLGRSFVPGWRQACEKHAPETNRFHETQPLPHAWPDELLNRWKAAR